MSSQTVLRISKVLVGLVCIGMGATAQIRPSFKASISYFDFRYNTLQVDPGPNWRGYNLNGENGLAVQGVGGIHFKDKLFIGLGGAYYHFEGIQGLAVYSDIDYVPLKSRLSPLLGLQIGYSHLWNQHENGTGTGLVVLGLGLQYRISPKLAVYAQSGMQFTQQSLLAPYSLGLRF